MIGDKESSWRKLDPYKPSIDIVFEVSLCSRNENVGKGRQQTAFQLAIECHSISFPTFLEKFRIPYFLAACGQ
jgi:hypothetical protein